MTINIANIRKFIIVFTFLTIIFSGVVAAAQNDDSNDTGGISQPYIMATHSVSGTVAIADNEQPSIIQDVFLAQPQSPAKFIVADSSQVKARVIYVTSTGYNSEVRQTDDSPFITANGEYVYWGGVAANFLPFGTKIKIPDYYGDKTFTVNDRMNQRYWERVDVWFPERSQAVQWGRRTIKIEVL